MSYEPGEKLEEKTEKPEEKPKEKPKAEAKPAEFKLPEWVHALPEKLETLGGQLADLTKSVESLKPESTEPCPGCGTSLPRSKAVEVKEHLKHEAPERRVVERVPEVKEVEKLVEKEVPKIPEATVMETIKRTFPERPAGEVIDALQRFINSARETGWIK